MTYGSCHRMCESNVHAWLKPSASARRVMSITRCAGGSVCRVTPMSMPLRLRPGERAPGELVEGPHGELEVLRRRVLLLGVAHPAEALHEEHHRGEHARHL